MKKTYEHFYIGLIDGFAIAYILAGLMVNMSSNVLSTKHAWIFSHWLTMFLILGLIVPIINAYFDFRQAVKDTYVKNNPKI